jgi:hypothetical protein
MYMEAHMDINKKTTILFTYELHEALSRLADSRGVSLGHLVREACVSQYGLKSRQDKLKAVKELATFNLPVAEPDELKKQLVPDPEDLLP